MNNRKKGIILSYISTGVNMVSGLVFSSFLLRMLGDTEYGIYQTVSSFVNYLVLLEFGTGTVMTRNVSMCRGRGVEQKEINRNISTVWSITAVLAVVIGVAAIGFYHALGPIFSGSMTPDQLNHGRQIFVVAAVYLVVSFLLQTINGVILAYERYSYASMVNILRTVMKLVLLLAAVSCWRNAIVIALVDALLSVACLVCAYCYCKKLGVRFRLGTLDRDVLRTAAPLCLAIFLQAIVNQANNNVDKFIIGIKLSPQSVSLYSVALYIFSVFSSLTTIPISMYAPAVSKRVVQNATPDELTDELVAPCRLTAAIGGAVLFGFAAVGRQFVQILYGEQYQGAWLIALILMAPMYLNMVTGVLVSVLDAMNKRMIRSVALVLTTAANIVLTIVWLDRWGVIGAALATAVCTLAGQVLLMSLYYGGALKIRIVSLYCRAFSGVLPGLLLGCAAGLLVGRMVPGVEISFLLGGVTFVCTAAGFILLLGLSPAEKNAVSRWLHRGK